MSEQDEPESRQHLEAAREIMLRAKGYADRRGRSGRVDRLLYRNFGQRPPQQSAAAYREAHERIFGAERPPLNPGQREGYSVRVYRGSVLPMELDNMDPHGLDSLPDPGSDE